VYESRMLEAASESLQEAYVTLSQSVDDFNDYVRGLRTEDRAAIIKLRSAINEYNGLTEESVTEMYDDFTEAEIEDLLDGLTDDEIADLGGEEAAAVYTYYNRAIIEWN